MCLDRIESSFNPPLKQMKGYQVVRKINDDRYSSVFRDTIKKMGVRHKAKKECLRPAEETALPFYHSGFHCFTNKKGARRLLNYFNFCDKHEIIKKKSPQHKYRIIEVIGYNIPIIGIQTIIDNQYNIFVADEIIITKEMEA